MTGRAIGRVALPVIVTRHLTVVSEDPLKEARCFCWLGVVEVFLVVFILAGVDHLLVNH